MISMLTGRHSLACRANVPGETDSRFPCPATSDAVDRLPSVGMKWALDSRNQVAFVLVFQYEDAIVFAAGVHADDDMSRRPTQLRRTLADHNFRCLPQVGRKHQ